MGTLNLSGNGSIENLSTLKVDGQLHYPCIAWARCSSSAFYAEEGFSAFTDNGTGDYSLTLDNAVADTNAAVATNFRVNSTGAQQWSSASINLSDTSPVGVAARQIDNDAPSFAVADMDPIHVAVFR